MRVRITRDYVEGPCSFAGRDGLYKVLAFEHSVGAAQGLALEPFARWQARHGTVHVCMELCDLVPALLPTLCRSNNCGQESLRRVVLYFPDADARRDQPAIALQFLLEPVRIEYIRIRMHNVKDIAMQDTGHEVAVGLRYRYLTVIRPEGHLQAGPYESCLYLDEGDGDCSDDERADLDELLRSGPQVAVVNERQTSQQQSPTVTLRFVDEDGAEFSALALRWDSGEEIRVQGARASLKENTGNAELVFDDIAMNYEPGATPARA